MWRKTDGKTSAEAPQSPAPTTTKSQAPAIQETPAVPPATPVAAAPAAIPAPEPTPAPRMVAPEPAATPAAGGESRIQAGLKIHGEITGNSDLYIDGELQGKIRLGNARVVVGPNGKVQADIEAGAITIEGSVQGNIKAGESVRLGPSSRMQGSVVTPRIGMDDGARLRGKVEMVKAGSAPSATAQTSAPSRAAEPETSRAVSASAKGE